MDIWGGLFNPAWRDHDPAVTAERLRNTAVFVGHATGAPSANDCLEINSPFEAAAAEMVSATASRYYVHRARAAKVDVDYVVLPEGRHTFGVFEPLLHRAWEQTIEPALYGE